MNRRQALTFGGLGLVGVGAWWTWPRPAPSIDTLMGELVATKNPQLIEWVTGKLRAGAPPKMLLSTAFHAPLVYHCDVSDIHAVLVQPAMQVLTQTSADRVPVCWSVQFAGQWLLDPSLEAPALAPSRAPFQEAVRAWDGPAAEAAIVQAWRAGGMHAAAEDLLPMTAWSRVDPHRAIFVAQALRGLMLFGDRYAEPVLRSVARQLSRREGGRFVASWREAQALSARPPGEDRWDPEAAAWLRAQLADPAAAPLEAAAQILSEYGPTTVWNAALMAGAEVLPLSAVESGAGVHTQTLLDALIFADTFTIEAKTRRLTALLACAWVHDLRSPQTGEPSPTTAPVGDAGSRALAFGDDPHAFKSAHALPQLERRVHPDWRAEWRQLVAHAPVLHGETPWPERQRVEALLRHG